MHHDGQDFPRLMERVKAGSEDAVRELLELYGDHILRAVRRRLNREMRKQFDSQDFVQAVCVSFFRRRETITRFKTPDELMAFLGTVAGNKVINECRRLLTTKKYNVNREHETGNEGGELDRSLTAKGATPSEIVATREQIDRLVEGQPSYYKRILQLRADGETFHEIAETTGLNERTVRRVVKRLAERLEK